MQQLTRDTTRENILLPEKHATKAVVPFSERPGMGRPGETRQEDRHRLAAVELFSLFTADIISLDVKFTR